MRTRSQAPVEDMAKKNVSFSTSVVYKDVERVRQLLQEGVDPSYDNNNAIRTATLLSNPMAKKVDPRTVELLTLLLADRRVDPSVDDNISLYHAAKTGNIEATKMLVNDKRFRITPRIKKLLLTLPKNTEVYSLLQDLVDTGKTPWERKEEIGNVELNKQKRKEIQLGLESRGVPADPGSGPLNKILDFANISRPAKGTGRRRRKTRKNGKTRRR